MSEYIGLPIYNGERVELVIMIPKDIYYLAEALESSKKGKVKVNKKWKKYLDDKYIISFLEKKKIHIYQKDEEVFLLKGFDSSLIK